MSLLSLLLGILLALFMFSIVCYWVLKWYVDHFGDTVITKIGPR